MLGRRIKSAVIIDPNKYAAQHLSQALHAEGLESVKHFTNSGEALESLALLPFGVAFVETEMAPMDGHELTKRIRRTRTMRSPRAPIFLMSQGVNAAVVAQATECGANAVLSKPIAPQAAIAAVRRVLETPRPFIDEAGYVGPCRRLGIAVVPSPCPQRRAEDKARLLEQRLAERALLVAALAEDGPAAMTGDSGAARRVQANAQQLADVSLLLGDEVLHWAAGALRTIARDDASPSLRDGGAVLFQALTLLADSEGDVEKRTQIAGLIRRALTRAA